jgi:hypothetical protein
MDLQLAMQSVAITTKVVSSIPAHGEMYSIQISVILYSYIFKILLYFLYLSKISYITSQNPIFFQN